MKIKLSVDDLLIKLKSGFKVSTRKDFLPAYAYTRIEALEDEVVFEFLNSRCEHIVIVKPETVEEQGVAVIDAKIFEDILKAAPDGSLVELERDDQKLIIERGTFKAKLSVLRDDQFPEINTSPKSINTVAELELGSEVISHLPWCVAPELSGHDQMSGILLEYDKEFGLRFAGFSPVQLQLLFVNKFKYDKSENFRVVLPNEIVELVETFAEGESVMKLYTSSNKMMITTSDAMIKFGLLEDGYPSSYVKELGVLDPFNDVYKAAIPKKSMTGKKELVFEERDSFDFFVDELLGSVKAISSIMSPTDLSILLEVKSKLDGKLVVDVMGESKLMGSEASDKVLADGVLDGSFVIGLSRERMSDVLKKFDSESQVRMWIKNEGTSVIFTEAKPAFDHIRLVGILMPQKMYGR